MQLLRIGILQSGGKVNEAYILMVDQPDIDLALGFGQLNYTASYYSNFDGNVILYWKIEEYDGLDWVLHSSDTVDPYEVEESELGNPISIPINAPTYEGNFKLCLKINDTDWVCDEFEAYDSGGGEGEDDNGGGPPPF